MERACSWPGRSGGRSSWASRSPPSSRRGCRASASSARWPATASRPVARATGLGAASSSCSYAAIAIAKSLFQKGASAASALAFQFASTNLVWELGLVLWVLIGWQFTLAEYVGGLVMIALMWAAAAALRLAPRRGRRARARPRRRRRPPAPRGRQRAALARAPDLGRRRGRTSPTTSAATGRCCGRRSSSASCSPASSRCWATTSSTASSSTTRPRRVQTLWGAVIGPVIAVLSFVCSVGNVPLAAVLWSGGLSFAGVMAFIFADLIVLPIIFAYRKYYGTSFALRITALMLVTMILAALVVDLVFSALGLIPDVAADHRRRLRLDRARLQARAQRLRDARLRRAHRPDHAPRRDRSGLRHVGRPGHRAAPRARRAARTTSAPSTAAPPSRPAAQVASRRTMAVTPTTTITPRSTAGCSRRP